MSDFRFCVSLAALLFAYGAAMFALGRVWELSKAVREERKRKG